MTLNETVALRIKQLCEEKNISLQGACKTVKGFRTYAKNTFKKRPPDRRTRVSTIIKICMGFNISMAYFFNTKEFESLD